MQIQPRDRLFRRQYGTQLQLCVPQVPAEGASDKALALFSFPSLTAYEQYRALFGTDPDFIGADHIRDESGCVLRYERTFMRPLLPGDPTD
jgi:NIPSNAP